MLTVKVPGWRPLQFSVEKDRNGRLLINDEHAIYVVAYDKHKCFLCEGALGNSLEEVLADVLTTRYEKARAKVSVLENLRVCE